MNLRIYQIVFIPRLIFLLRAGKARRQLWNPSPFLQGNAARGNRNLLREQLPGGAHHGRAHKTPAENTLIHGVRTSDDAHADVMRHIAFNHGISAAHTRRIKIDRFIKAVFSVQSERTQPAQVRRHTGGVAFQHEKA